MLLQEYIWYLLCTTCNNYSDMIVILMLSVCEDYESRVSENICNQSGGDGPCSSAQNITANTTL